MTKMIMSMMKMKIKYFMGEHSQCLGCFWWHTLFVQEISSHDGMKDSKVNDPLLLCLIFNMIITRRSSVRFLWKTEGTFLLYIYRNHHHHHPRHHHYHQPHNHHQDHHHQVVWVGEQRIMTSGFSGEDDHDDDDHDNHEVKKLRQLCLPADHQNNHNHGHNHGHNHHDHNHHNHDHNHHNHDQRKATGLASWYWGTFGIPKLLRCFKTVTCQSGALKLWHVNTI